MSAATIEPVEVSEASTGGDHKPKHGACPICHPPEQHEVGDEVEAYCGVTFTLTTNVPGPPSPNTCVVCIDLSRGHYGRHVAHGEA